MTELLIVPIGSIEEGLLPRLARGLRSALDFDTRIAGSIAEPTAGFIRRRQQHNAGALLDLLSQRRNDGGPILGITGLDLFVPGLNFVFGVADRKQSLALVSIARLKPEYYGQPPDESILDERLLKEAVHELGHVLGLDHCHQPGCIMVFSNAISDTDRKGPGFCYDCRLKLAGRTEE